MGGGSKIGVREDTLGPSQGVQILPQQLLGASSAFSINPNPGMHNLVTMVWYQVQVAKLNEKT